MTTATTSVTTGPSCQSLAPWADFEELLHGVHERGMRLILDLVPNHCSDEHPWFQQARQSKDDPHHNYFHWQPPGPDGGPPNNWRSYFSGPAWTYNEPTDEYYLHLFSKRQPDLNWENPAVRQEIFDIIDFWFAKGIDGFRMDVITLISKRDGYPSATTDNFMEVAESLYANGPQVHEYLREMHKQVLSRYDVVSLGEGVGIKPSNALQYVGEDRGELNLVYHFDMLHLINSDGRFSDLLPFSLVRLKQMVQTWYDAVGDSGWIVNTLGNHDYARLVSRFGDDQQHRAASAKLWLTFLATVRGTLGIYQGDELGMTNVAFDSIEDYRDVETLNLYRERSTGLSETEQQDLLAYIQPESRDNARTPFQWDDTPHAGFSESTPWIRVNPNYTNINARQQEDDPHSVLNFYRRMLRLRKATPALVYGDYRCLNPDHETVYSYERVGQDQTCYVLLNFSDETVNTKAPIAAYEVLINNYTEVKTNAQGLIELAPYQAVILS